MYSKEQQSGRRPKSPAARIKLITVRRQQLNDEMRKAYDEIDQEREPVCQGCQAPEFEHSHSIPKNYKDYKFIADERNIWLLCRDCHTLFETGWVWMLEHCGEEIMANILACDEDYYRQKREQVRKRLESYKAKNWLAISQGNIKIPEWIEKLVEE